MTTVPQAIKNVSKRHPDVEVKRVAVLNQDFYIVYAPVKGVKTDYNDPYYLVDTDDGEVFTFSPIEYMDAVKDAFDNREVDLKKAGVK